MDCGMAAKPGLYGHRLLRSEEIGVRKACLALLLLPSVAAAQWMPPLVFRQHFGDLRQRGLLPDPINPLPNPMEPGQRPTDEAPEPEQDQRPPQNSIRFINADRKSGKGDEVVLEGNVHIQYRGYDLYANRIEGNTRTRVFTLVGGGRLEGNDMLLRGERITVDFRTDTFTADDHSGILLPALLQGNTEGPLYIRGKYADGTPDEIHLKVSKVTTCEYDHPHYELDGENTTIRPEKRVILRNARFRLFGKTLLRIPYLVIPLDTRRERYTPEVGKTPDQGYYIKTQWGIPTRGPNDLTGYVDYFEKLGAGLGARFRYAGESHQGFIRAYGLTGSEDTKELNIGHRQFIGSALFSVESNLQNRNYLNAPENKIWQTRASLILPQGRNNTRFNYSRNSNESPTFRSVQEVLGMSDQRIFDQRTRWTLDASWVRSLSEFSTADPVKREQVDVRFRGTKDLVRLVAELEYQRSIPVGETANFFSTGDRTPLLALRSDSGRLFGPAFAQSWPFRTELSVGEFVNPSNRERVTRSFFDIDLNRADNSSQRQGFGINARFRQGVYSDGTAQFATQLNASYRYNFTSETAFNLRYNFLRPRGFTPLAIDRVGNTNFASADISFKVARPLTLGLQSSYDFRYEDNGLSTGWQQVAARMEYLPHDWLQLRSLSSYDPVLKKWTNTRVDLAYARNDTFVGVGARYDGIRKVWGNLNVFADGLRWGRLSASFLANYNGYTKQFDSRQFSFAYDLHCGEAVLQILENNIGFRSGREIYLFLRIKALPFDSRFGTGTQGQPIGIGTGQGF
jgi:hypothetical protein